jgi:hypothetical protein
MRNADWFSEAKWGVFTHYLTNPEMSGDDWNRRVDAFDVEKLCDQLEAAQVGYYFMTLGQGSGHYCTPNKTYDDIIGRKTGKCSDRDLIEDLYDALSKQGIELLVYIAATGACSRIHASDEFRRGRRHMGCSNLA